MSTYSIEEAEAQLSDLIDRALAGEPVVITSNGYPVVELRPARQPQGPITAADLDWLAKRRVGMMKPDVDAGTLMSQLRDEWER